MSTGDLCSAHEHFGRDCYRHHFGPSRGTMRCPYCGRVADSVRGESVARKHQDKYGDW